MRTLGPENMPSSRNGAQSLSSASILSIMSLSRLVTLPPVSWKYFFGPASLMRPRRAGCEVLFTRENQMRHTTLAPCLLFTCVYSSPSPCDSYALTLLVFFIHGSQCYSTFMVFLLRFFYYSRTCYKIWYYSSLLTIPTRFACCSLACYKIWCSSSLLRLLVLFACDPLT